MQPTATEVVVRDVTITMTISFKTANRTVPHGQALAYVRQYLEDTSDAGAFSDIREVVITEELVPQDELDNAEIFPCIRCGRPAFCDCSDQDIADAVAEDERERSDQLWWKSTGG